MSLFKRQHHSIARMSAVLAHSCFPQHFDMLSWKDMIKIRIKKRSQCVRTATCLAPTFTICICVTKRLISHSSRVSTCVPVITRHKTGWLFFSQNITVKRDTDYYQYASYSFAWLRIRRLREQEGFHKPFVRIQRFCMWQKSEVVGFAYFT